MGGGSKAAYSGTHGKAHSGRKRLVCTLGLLDMFDGSLGLVSDDDFASDNPVHNFGLRGLDGGLLRRHVCPSIGPLGCDPRVEART